MEYMYTKPLSNLSTLPPEEPVNRTASYVPCRWILENDIPGTKAHIWDMMILLPNALFATALLIHLCCAYRSIRLHFGKPVIMAFYLMMWIVSSIGVIRSVVAMLLNLAVPWQDEIEKTLWLVLRFFLLAAELAVVVFAVLGQSDKTGIRKVLLIVCGVSLLYSCTQAGLEFSSVDKSSVFSLQKRNYDLYAHGGMLFLFSTSMAFVLIYSTIICLHFTKFSSRLPVKKSFYVYVAILAFLNLAQSAGSILLYIKVQEGLCVVMVTTGLYFTLYGPLVFFSFLWEFFRSGSGRQPHFSYHIQDDDGAGGGGATGVDGAIRYHDGGHEVSLPYQGSDKDLYADANGYSSQPYDHPPHSPTGRGDTVSLNDSTAFCDPKEAEDRNVFVNTADEELLASSLSNGSVRHAGPVII